MHCYDAVLTSIQGCFDVMRLQRRSQTWFRRGVHAGLKEETKEKHLTPVIYK